MSFSNWPKMLCPNVMPMCNLLLKGKAKSSY
jgi:hypothetical protein